MGTLPLMWPASVVARYCPDCYVTWYGPEKCWCCGQPGRVGYLHPCVVSRDTVPYRPGDPPDAAGGHPT